MYLYIFQFLFMLASFKCTLPPQPTIEIQKLINDLGDKNYRKREIATKKLIELKYNALQACIDNKTHTDPEIGERCQKISELYFNNVYKIQYPSIYLLDNDRRYPLGFTCKMAENGNWCEDFETPIDISVMYYKRALEIYNNSLDKDQVKYGGRISYWEYRNTYIEELAMKLYVRDILYFGVKYEEIQKILENTNNKGNRYIYSVIGGEALRYGYPFPPGPVYKRTEED